MNMRTILGTIEAAGDVLWLLSRMPGLAETAKSEHLAEVQRRGYDTGKLTWVEQQ